MSWADLKDTFVRVGPKLKCPICGKRDGCLVEKNGLYVICMHNDSNTRWNNGWFHALTEEEAHTVFKSLPDEEDTEIEPVDFNRLHAVYRTLVKDEHFHELAEQLKVSAWSLDTLLVGYSIQGNYWTIPLWDGECNLIGIHRRYKDGSKKAMVGSKLGVILPCDFYWGPEVPVFVTEGLSDTAAALDLGLNAIGRCSAWTSNEYFPYFVSNRIVYIIPDKDQSGAFGAAQLKEQLRNIATVADIVTLPYGDSSITDLRSFRNKVGAAACLSWILRHCGN